MFTQAHITKDTTFLNNIFTNHANAYPPNSDVVNGRTAIAKVNSEWVNFGIYQYDFTKVIDTPSSASNSGLKVNNSAFVICIGLKYYLLKKND